MDVKIDLTGIELTTSRLTLRPLALSDAEDFYAYASVPGVGESAGWKHHESMEESQAILQMLVGQKNIFAVVHRADRKMIGTVGLHGAWANEDEAYRQYAMKEIGYVLSKAYWGQGLMTVAVTAVIGYCFDTLKLDALACSHFVDNEASRRVIEKSGFCFVKQSTFVAEALHKTFEDMEYIRFRDPERQG